jgi:cytochrome P450
MKYPAGPKGSLITGMAMVLVKDPKQFFHKTAMEYPEITRFRSFYNHFYVLSKPEYVQHMLQKNAKNYKKGLIYDQMKHVLGEGLLTSDGEYWLRQRRLAQPSFHRNKIASFFEIMSHCTKSFVSEWQKQDGEKIDVYPDLMRLTLDIIGRTMLSTHESENADVVREALEKTLFGTQKRIESIVKWPLWIPTKVNQTIKEGRGALDKIIYGIIERKRKGLNKHDDLLDMLMEAKDADTGAQMNDEQLRDEILTIFLAGHETTAIVLSWALYILGTKPREVQQLKNELDSVLDGAELKMDHLKALEYMTQFINEVMRMHPPAYAIGRTATENDQIGGYDVPKGEHLIISIHHLHNDPKFWDKPDEFNPDRFKNFDYRANAFRFMPFGGGPRICIGNNFAMMEMQIVLVHFLQNFQFQYLEKNPPETVALITDRPKNGIPLRVSTYE